MNYIEYDGNKRFHGDAAYYGLDGLLMEGKADQRIALFGSELTADDLTFEAVSQYLIDNRPISGYPDYLDFTPGAVLNLYNMIGGMNIGRGMFGGRMNGGFGGMMSEMNGGFGGMMPGMNGGAPALGTQQGRLPQSGMQQGQMSPFGGMQQVSPFSGQVQTEAFFAAR